jgi:hypothetical protein
MVGRRDGHDASPRGEFNAKKRRKRLAWIVQCSSKRRRRSKIKHDEGK